MILKNYTVYMHDNKSNNKKYIGRKYSEEEKAKLSSKKENKMKTIIQIDINTNEIIKEWMGIKKTARFFNINSSSLFDCLNGKQHTCCGFKWIYKKVGD
jgi:hypothetical protein